MKLPRLQPSLDSSWAVLLEDAINFLPRRSIRAATLHRRHTVQCLMAAGIGLVLAFATAYWQQMHVERDDARRVELEQRLRELEPALAARAKLLNAIAAHERRGELMASLGVPRDDFLRLLLALSWAQTPELVLDEIHYRAGGASVVGMAASERALTAWMQGLERVVGLDDIAIADLKAVPASDARASFVADSSEPGRIGAWAQAQTVAVSPIAFTVHIVVGDDGPRDRVPGAAALLRAADAPRFGAGGVAAADKSMISVTRAAPPSSSKSNKQAASKQAVDAGRNAG